MTAASELLRALLICLDARDAQRTQDACVLQVCRTQQAHAAQRTQAMQTDTDTNAGTDTDMDTDTDYGR